MTTSASGRSVRAQADQPAQRRGRLRQLGDHLGESGDGEAAVIVEQLAAGGGELRSAESGDRQIRARARAARASRRLHTDRRTARRTSSRRPRRSRRSGRLNSAGSIGPLMRMSRTWRSSTGLAAAAHLGGERDLYAVDWLVVAEELFDERLPQRRRRRRSAWRSDTCRIDEQHHRLERRRPTARARDERRPASSLTSGSSRARTWPSCAASRTRDGVALAGSTCRSSTARSGTSWTPRRSLTQARCAVEHLDDRGVRQLGFDPHLIRIRQIRRRLGLRDPVRATASRTVVTAVMRLDAAQSCRAHPWRR